MKHLLGGILVGSLFLFSCGGDDDSASTAGGDDTADDSGGGDSSDSQTNAYVEVLAATMSQEESEPQLDETQSNCLATAIVNTVGADRLAEAGVTPQQLAEADNFAEVDVELPEDAASNLASGITGCGLTPTVVDLIVAQFATEMGSELPEEAAACLGDVIDDQAASEAMASIFLDGSEDTFLNVMFDAVGQCPQVMTAMMVAQAPGPVSAEDTACMQSVIEDNADVVRTALLEQDAAAGEQLGTLIATNCPGLAGAFAGG